MDEKQTEQSIIKRTHNQSRLCFAEFPDLCRTLYSNFDDTEKPM